MLLIRTVPMGDSSQMSNPTGWTKGDVLALLALLVGFPADCSHSRCDRYTGSVEEALLSSPCEPGTYEVQSRSTSSFTPMAEGSSERSRMYRGRDVELQELGISEDINFSGESDLLDLPFMGVRTLKGDRQCRQRPRQYASTAVDDTAGTSIVREDKLQSQKAR
ncbi:hypothetical protein MMC22_009610 [Lobaria immixta]|nr:hypothetical protein [Lobaria immixta]